MRKPQNESIHIFSQKAQEYDHWFDVHRNIFDLEVKALRQFIPENAVGLEVGVGSGRFAKELGIEFGIDPAPGMKALAEKRGIKVQSGSAEDIPFEDERFDYTVMITVLCFLKDVHQALVEAIRVTKPGGRIIIGLIDGDSHLGKKYKAEKATNQFYRHAHFPAARDVETLLRKLSLIDLKTVQTLLPPDNQNDQHSEITNGYGDGGFVVFCAKKKPLQK